MSTIRLTRSDRLALHLEFDYDGACELLRCLQTAVNGGDTSVQIEFDRGVTKKKRYSTTVARTMTVSKSESDAIEEIGDRVNLAFEEDTLEYAVARFQKCLDTSEFDPPELCELSVAGSRDAENDLYGILLK